MNIKTCLFTLLCCLCQFALFAQDTTEQKKLRQHVYATNGGDGPILSFGNVKMDGAHVNTAPRFTLFFNVGRNYNYDFTKWLGIYSGVDLKNIGIITKENGTKLKRRVYTLGVPLGLKIGDVRGQNFFFFLGGQYDLAFNYKEKQFINGDKAKKFNEWFSDRTPLLMPSLFAGFRFYPGIGLKVQYYPNNFFNKDFKETVAGVTTYPYRNMESKMFFVTLTYSFGDTWPTQLNRFGKMLN
ncbi:MAG: outer rane beta-barrel protein [Bacteroidetes bacterium]|uniref:outer membrane beta-barrel protein n=1 Tax=[Flexibacter] sp. ATCC 35208 TaxID=1936242 RepID=UPI0009CD2A31|nr:outer membrane beta-barrel protein [[Flexibacter] sp. ATCC 35208]MBP1651391.1 outer rane beta-barrel protein [Bacteroidota bacterium]OMP79572.1 hypothetical protein BW716_09490 [[Flexibacter] sp. ATCC 35208]